MKLIIIPINLFIILFFLACTQKSSIETKFIAANNLPWVISFEDDCSDSWQNNWVMDGERSYITHSSEGMDYFAGNEAHNDT